MRSATVKTCIFTHNISIFTTRMSDVASTPLASVPEDQPAASTSSLPPAAKAASELAVKTAIAESVSEKEEGEIVEDGSSASKSKGNGTIEADGTGMRTVFSDPANFNVVHPLYSKWYALVSA